MFRHRYLPAEFFAAYSLYDLDKDGIPELFISKGTGTYDEVEVYSYGKKAETGVPGGTAEYQMCMAYFGDTSTTFGMFGQVYVSDEGGKVMYASQNKTTGNTYISSFVMKGNTFQIVYDYMKIDGEYYNGYEEATAAQFNAAVNEYNAFIGKAARVGREYDAADLTAIEKWS